MNPNLHTTIVNIFTNHSIDFISEYHFSDIKKRLEVEASLSDNTMEGALAYMLSEKRYDISELYDLAEYNDKTVILILLYAFKEALVIYRSMACEFESSYNTYLISIVRNKMYNIIDSYMYNISNNISNYSQLTESFEELKI